jgi:hypothetical protein
MPPRIVVIAVLAGAAGCGLFEPDSRRVVGLIDPGLGVQTIEAPDTVRVDVAFAATVNTFGSSNCTIPDGVRLTLGPSEARVIPYDRIPRGDEVCTAEISPLPHPVELRFTSAGAAAIVAEGVVALPAGGVGRGTVTKALVVVP